MTVASHTAAELEESTASSRPLTYTTTTITLERVAADQHWIHTCKEGIIYKLTLTIITIIIRFCVIST